MVRHQLGFILKYIFLFVKFYEAFFNKFVTIFLTIQIQLNKIIEFTLNFLIDSWFFSLKRLLWKSKSVLLIVAFALTSW